MNLSQKVFTFLHDFKTKMKIWGVIAAYPMKYPLKTAYI